MPALPLPSCHGVLCVFLPSYLICLPGSCPMSPPWTHLSLVPPDSTLLSRTMATHTAGGSLSSLQDSEDSLSSEGLPVQAWGQWVAALKEICLKFGRP